MSTPAGLTRFQRSMTTRYNGTCAFCGDATHADTDFAARAGDKWIAVCTPCSVSIAAQVRGKVRQMQARAAGADEAVIAAVMVVMPTTDAMAAAMQDGVTEAAAYDVLLKLDAALALLVVATRPENPLQASLQAVADNASATPKDREMAGSFARWLDTHDALTDRQAYAAKRILASYSPAMPVASAEPVMAAASIGLYQHDDGNVRKVYETQNGRIACKLLIVHGAHGSFEYEKGGRTTVTTALATGTAHAMTQDEAAAFGRLHSFCCNCCRDLDDDRSLAAGYGPTCAANMGWSYPSYEQASEILGRPAGKAKPPAA